MSQGYVNTFVATALGKSDVVDLSRGVVTGGVTAAASDTFEFSDAFGCETIDKFVAGRSSTHDFLLFAADDFGSFAAVKAAMTQVGADVVIKRDSLDEIVLNGVSMSRLVAADFKFV